MLTMTLRTTRRYCDDPDCLRSRKRNLARQYRRPKLPVRTVQADNAVVVAEAARLYIPDGAIVADVTWGKGAFWAKTKRRKFTVIGSDVDRHFGGAHVQADFRAMPYRDQSIDVVVLDPPYIAWAGNHITNSRYNNGKTTGKESGTPLYHDGIIQLYREGMTEAFRVLKPGGFCWVKGKDEVNSGRQHWAHRQIPDIADRELGFYMRDLFIVLPPGQSPSARWTSQHHARKVHSYLWIFEKRITRASAN
jgi:hypothetical protein